jgi:uncharacterized membrane protein
LSLCPSLESRMKGVTGLSVALIAAAFLISICVYSYLPEMVASHWNAMGEVDGYLPRFWGAFLVPLIMVGLYLLFLVIPLIDPLKENIMQFISYYYGFVVVMLLFMFIIHNQVTLWNLGFAISPNIILPIGIGVLFIYVGLLLGKAKRNWFIGIRTPWTLSSDAVWAKTHRIGGRLFMFAGVISIVGVLLPDYAFLFILLPVLVVAFYTIAYSYFAYQDEIKRAAE